MTTHEMREALDELDARMSAAMERKLYGDPEREQREREEAEEAAWEEARERLYLHPVRHTTFHIKE